MWSAKVLPHDPGSLTAINHSVHKAQLAAAIKAKKPAPDPGPST